MAAVFVIEIFLKHLYNVTMLCYDIYIINNKQGVIKWRKI